MSIETPKNKSEQIASAEEMSPEEIKYIEEEEAVEMSPEDFQLMVSEVSTFKEMLKEWIEELANLERNPNATIKDIERLKTDINNLRYQISEREELLEE